MERALLTYGRRYNYLGNVPDNLRDDSIDVGEIFELNVS
jgi:hypothetical protein